MLEVGLDPAQLLEDSSRQQLKARKRYSYLMNYNKDAAAVDISGIQPSQGNYICPFCGVVMLPIHYSAEAVSLEVQYPSCGYRLDPTTTEDNRRGDRG